MHLPVRESLWGRPHRGGSGVDGGLDVLLRGDGGGLLHPVPRGPRPLVALLLQYPIALRLELAELSHGPLHGRVEGSLGFLQGSLGLALLVLALALGCSPRLVDFALDLLHQVLDLGWVEAPVAEGLVGQQGEL